MGIKFITSQGFAIALTSHAVINIPQSTKTEIFNMVLIKIKVCNLTTQTNYDNF